MTKTYKTYRRLRRFLVPLAASFALLLGTAPAAWGQQRESKPSAPRVKSSPSPSPRSSGELRSSPRSAPRTSAPPSSRGSGPSTRSGGSSSGSGTVTPTYPRSGSGTSVRPLLPEGRGEGPRGYDGPWREGNPPRGLQPPPGGSRPGGGSGYDHGHDSGHGHGHGYHGHGSRGYYPYYFYWNYPRYYGSLFSFGLGYYPRYYYSPYAYDYPYYPYYPRYGRVAYEPQGALDLNVKPKDTQVFVNGYFVGTTGDFDGWPRYLWLDEDTYELILYQDGYETVVKQIAVRPDLVIDVKLQMQPGKSVAPEDLTRYRGESGRDEDDRYDRDRERYGSERYDRERDDRDRESRGRYEVEYGTTTRPESTPAPPEELDTRTEAGRVHMTISPAEASVYLDGRFVGIGGELSSVKEGLLMDPGEHHLQIFHPQYETREQTFTVAAGEEVKVEIDLAR